VQLQGSDLLGIMERLWDGSCDCGVALEGYKLFRRNRKRRQGRRVALCVRDQLEHMEAQPGDRRDEFRDEVRKVKVRMERNLAGDVKDNKKGFDKHRSDKGSLGECGPIAQQDGRPGYTGHGRG